MIVQHSCFLWARSFISMKVGFVANQIQLDFFHVAIALSVALPVLASHSIASYPSFGTCHITTAALDLGRHMHCLCQLQLEVSSCLAGTG